MDQFYFDLIKQFTAYKNTILRRRIVQKSGKILSLPQSYAFYHFCK